MTGRSFLFLQGPSSAFFTMVAAGLESRGHRVHRINLCVGDQVFWRRPGAVHYRGRLDDWPAFIADFLDQWRITDLLLIGEQRDHHKSAIAAAQQRGARVVVTDFGYLRPDWIILERDGMSGQSHFPKEPAAILEMALDCPVPDLRRRYADSFWRMALSEMLYHLSTYFFWWLYPHYRSFKAEDPLLAYLGTGLRLLLRPWQGRQAEATHDRLVREKAPHYLFPLQMENDFQIRAYSRYPDMATPIREVIESFASHARPDCHLLIKVHPWDPGLKNWGKLVRMYAERSGVSKRIHYLDGGNLNDMIATSLGMVTINSTSGIQALSMGAPVIALGQAVYAIPGLTFQGPLDGFWSQAAPPDPILGDAFIRAIAACLHVRGVFYRQPGLDAAVAAAVQRLDADTVNRCAAL